MQANYQPVMLRHILESENLADSKSNIIESLKNSNKNKPSSYDFNNCPVFSAILTKKCPSKEQLISYDKTTKIFKMNVDTLTSEQKSKLLGLVGDLLK